MIKWCNSCEIKKCNEKVKRVIVFTFVRYFSKNNEKIELSILFNKKDLFSIKRDLFSTDKVAKFFSN